MTTRVLRPIRRAVACALVFVSGIAFGGGLVVSRAGEPLPSLDPPTAVLSMPGDATGLSGATVDVALSVAPGDGILGIDTTVTYDPAVLQAQSVTTWGIAATAGFGLVANVATPGVVVITTYATSAPLSGSGEIARIRFHVIGEAGASSPLALASASLNEGQIPATLLNGLFTVAATTTVLSMPGDVQGGPGSTVQVPITATPADGILAIDMAVRYDPAILQVQGVAVSGIAADAGFAWVANTGTPGAIVISMYATASALAGAGEILRVTFTVNGTPGSWSDLTFASASINEGAIPVAFVHGLFSATCAGAANGTPCNDGDPTTCGDVCGGGVCAGTPTAEPAEVNDSVRVSQNGTDASLGWSDPPGPFNVYRGTFGIGSEVPFSYNHGCFNPAGPLGSPPALDSETPPVGWVFYYLVTRLDQCRESNPGRNSAGTPIPNAHPCPSP